MTKKTYWFKAGQSAFGERDVGFIPSGWKGWLFTVVCVVLALGAWRLAVFAGARHWSQVAWVSWTGLGLVTVVYVVTACLKSK